MTAGGKPRQSAAGGRGIAVFRHHGRIADGAVRVRKLHRHQDMADSLRRGRSAAGTRGSIPATPVGLSAPARHYIRDLVYGANDGIITTFAVVAGVAGGALSARAVLVVGAANLAADGLSM